MRTILINSSNLVKGYKNRFRYEFPTPWQAPRGAKIALQQISIYNSTFNIKPSYGNDVITMIFGGTSYNFKVPPGYYSLADLNNFLQAQFILNNLYAVAPDGSFVYFATLQENPTQYSSQLNLYPLDLSSAYSAPAGSNLQLTANGLTPQFTVTDGLGKLLGFPVGLLPTTPHGAPKQYVSQDFGLSPVLSPVDTYVLRCNLIQNKFANPNDYFTQIPLSSSLGQLITQQIGSLSFCDIYPSQYNFIEINLTDQFFQPLENQDSAMTLTLIIESPE